MKISPYKPIIRFVIITFGLSWICWGGSIFVLQMEPYAYASSTLVMAGNFMPSIIGLVFIKAQSKQNVLNLFAIFQSFMVRPTMYLLAIVTMPLVIWIAYLFGSFFQVVEFDSILFPIIYPSIWPVLLLIPFFVIMQGPLGEEYGWRKYMLTNLLQRLSALRASLLVGVVWSLWHVPKFFMEGTIQFELALAHGYILTLLGYTFYTLCLSLIITVLYLQSDQKIIIPLLFHAMANFSHGLITMLIQPYGAMLILITTCIASMLFWYKQKSRRTCFSNVSEA